MLKTITKNITATSGSCIGDKEVSGFSVTINSDNPVEMNISTWINNRELYRENIQQCRADEEEFRAFARELQDELLAEEENVEGE